MGEFRRIIGLLALVTVTFVATLARAQSPDLSGYWRFINGLEKRYMAREETMCVAEHVCALGGPLAQRWNCDLRVDVCLSYSDKPSHALNKQYKCRQILGQLNQSQRRFLAAPQGCAKPPAAAAVAAVFTSRESSCAIEKTCPSKQKDFARWLSCTQLFGPCDKAMDSLSPLARQSCRANRDKLFSLTGCRAETDIVWARSIAASAPTSRATSLRPPPKTWREQARRAMEPDPTDDFSLGEFDE